MFFNIYFLIFFFDMLTKETRSVVIELHKTGIPSTPIVKQLGISRQSVFNIIKRFQKLGNAQAESF